MKQVWSVLCLLVALAAFVLLGALTAQAHTDEELETWLIDWEDRVNDPHAHLDYQLITEYRDMADRHPCREILETLCTSTTAGHDDLPTVNHSTGMGTGVERWRSVVQIHFGPNTEAALRVMRCESGGNEHAYNGSSGASGLFQFLPSTWRSTTGDTYPGGVFDGNDNIAAAAKLSGGGTSWGPWVCKP